MQEEGRFIRRTSEGPATEERLLHTSAGDFRLKVRVSDGDRLGCVLESLTITPLGGARAVIEPAEARNRLAYLEGGLTVVEVEGPGKRAILKSAVVRRDEGTLQFLELVIDPASGITLGHYLYDEAAGERKGVAAPMTYDTVDRLVFDLLDLLQARA